MCRLQSVLAVLVQAVEAYCPEGHVAHEEITLSEVELPALLMNVEPTVASVYCLQTVLAVALQADEAYCPEGHEEHAVITLSEEAVPAWLMYVESC
jgi:hypothetical protein